MPLKTNTFPRRTLGLTPTGSCERPRLTVHEFHSRNSGMRLGSFLFSFPSKTENELG
jgi:hypothetical protein